MSGKSDKPTLGEGLLRRGISRRSFLQFCAGMASLMGLPPLVVPRMVEALTNARPSVIYLSFQECTGCLESLTRSVSPTLEDLIFNSISLDYQETLQAAAGSAAKSALEKAMADNFGQYILLVDGSIPLSAEGMYSVVAGVSNLDRLRQAASGAAFILSMGTCASFGGLPKAKPNPTGAVSVADIIQDRPVVNVSGCPPIPEVMTGVVVYYLTYHSLPPLDSQRRPIMFYGETVHDDCHREDFFEERQFAQSFGDPAARAGHCLFELGCKGPATHNACARIKWNQGTSYPMRSGHGCLGCSEPNFWDRGSFYTPLPVSFLDD